MFKRKILIALILFLIVPILLSAQIMDSLSTTILDSCLSYLHLNPYELGFEKAWVKDDTFKLKIIDYLLDNPLELPEYVEKTIEVADKSVDDPIEFLEYASKQLDCELGDVILENSVSAIAILETAMTKAEKYRKQALSELDKWELHDLIMSVPGLWADEGDPNAEFLEGVWQREFHVEVDTSRVVDKDRLLNIIKKIDRVSLNKAGMIFSGIVWEIFHNTNWEEEEFTVPNHILMGVQGEILMHLDTSFGSIVVGGKGDNVYSDDYAIIIDLGGNDTYRCRAGGALGELSNPFSAVIDYSGNDIYFEGEKAVNQGSGFLGCGILIDAKGNDVYHGADYCQGVGILGTGILIDQSGKDDYRAGVFSQAAGNVGIGILMDQGEEDDRYFAKIWAQGMGSVFGYGLLFDEGGDDSYRTGGEYLHAPLLPNDYQSFSHGFGMGWRPRAGGGIGVLYDKSGNDFYDGEVFCQGSAYWYSLGMLIDGEGNDSYNAAQYGQGAGIHLAIGALWDQGGDDQYHSRNGVIGGTAHDLSVAMLVDEAGDDYYTVSGGYGVALTNSFALFIDKLGNDMYSTWEDHSFGSVRWARGFAGCGIFMDLEGKDRYSRNTLAKDGGLWTYNGWGIGIDLDRDIVTKPMEEVKEEIVLTAADSLKTVKELFDEASLWEVGSNRKKVARAKKAFLEREVEAVEYICENKLGTDSSLELRLIDTITKEYPDSIAPLLLTKIKDGNKKVQSNAIRLIGIAKYRDAFSPLIEMLGSEEYDHVKRSLIGALGSIGNKDATQTISSFITDEDELCRLSVVSALKKLKDSASNETLIKALDDSIFTVRSAVTIAIVELADLNITQMLRKRIINDQFNYPELAVRTLSNIELSFADSTKKEYKKQRKRSQKLFIQLTTNSDERVRAEAVKAVFLNCPKKRELLTEFMSEEQNPFVNAVYEEIIKKDKKRKK